MVVGSNQMKSCPLRFNKETNSCIENKCQWYIATHDSGKCAIELLGMEMLHFFMNKIHKG